MATRSSGPSRWQRRGAPAAPAVGRVRLLDTGHWRIAAGRRRAPRLIAVGAARAGTGKSVVASNLAVAIAGLGHDVVLVDLDFGAPRLQSMFGIAKAAPGVGAWLDGEIDGFDAALTSTIVRRLHIVAGARRTVERERRRELVERLRDVESEVVIVDIGATNRDDLFDLFAEDALCLLACGPDRLALETAFGFLAGAAARATARYGEGARAALAAFRGRLVGNRTETPEQANAFHAFSRLVHEELGIPLPVLGSLQASGRIVENFGARRPLLARRGVDHNVRALHEMAELLVAGGAGREGGCALDGETPIVIADRPLPPDMQRHLRKHARYPVDWAATLILPDRVTDVRVLDVSYSGAALDAVGDLRVGDQGVLHLTQLPGQPALRVVLKHVLPALHRIGVAFAAPGDVSERLVAAGRATRAA